ncbi:MAG TPA: 1-phosphofructokinase [Candidatus Mediterraneibacter stercoravium]|uniref:Tagatose-6-phosphate kinase n=1 Tax=Candidatus Mediterraneibacter stercoravium TaxID=2838685 RepID=A0A9D2G9X0_9FIRM|nr:1-phosphofructokinase [Candidatus Mediterraneibacter stercoravium]
MIYTVTLNPALDKTVEIPSLTVDAVNRITSMRTDPGGKGINVSKVIGKLGGNSIAAGILGGDTGRAILSALESMGLTTCFHFVEGETRTNMKIIDPEAHTNTDINEPGVTVSEEILGELLTELLGKVTEKDIVVISGSMPKGSPQDTYYTWTKAFREKGAKVILDADGELLKAGLKASPYLIKPNNHELSALTGKTLETPKELEETARSLMKEYGIEKTVVSMGGAGALYVTADETIYAEGLKVPVGSTVGAGDSVVAALAVAEESGMSLEETVCLSTATGAANVMCSGTQAAEYEVIEKLIPKVVYHRI